MAIFETGSGAIALPGDGWKLTAPMLAQEWMRVLGFLPCLISLSLMQRKKKLGGHTGPFALRVALAQEAKGARTRRGLRIQQLTISTMAA